MIRGMQHPTFAHVSSMERFHSARKPRPSDKLHNESTSIMWGRVDVIRYGAILYKLLGGELRTLKNVCKVRWEASVFTVPATTVYVEGNILWGHRSKTGMPIRQRMSEKMFGNGTVTIEHWEKNTPSSGCNSTMVTGLQTKKSSKEPLAPIRKKLRRQMCHRIKVFYFIIIFFFPTF